MPPMRDYMDAEENDWRNIQADITAIGILVSDLALTIFMGLDDPVAHATKYAERVHARGTTEIIHPGTAPADFLQDVSERAHQKLLFRVGELVRQVHLAAEKRSG